MKFHNALLLLFTCLLALPTGAVRACGDNHGNQDTAAAFQTNDDHASCGTKAI